MRDVEECKHGMIPAYCADCRNLKTPEEAELEEDKKLLTNLNEWHNK